MSFGEYTFTEPEWESGCQIVDQLVNKNKQINALKALDNNKLLPPPCNGPAKKTSLGGS